MDTQRTQAVASGQASIVSGEMPFLNRRDPARALGPDGRPQVSRRAPIWADVPDEKWDDWRWQLSHRMNELSEIEQVLQLTDDEREGLSAPDKFRVDITPYFLSLIDPTDGNDPIRRQVIPLGREHEAFTAMMEDSLAEDRHSPVPGLVHRYPDRVLMLVTTQCASYCRYCTRSRIVGDPTQNFNRKDHEAQLEYLRRTPQVRDVLISGGDGLTLAPKLFETIIRGLREIPHIEIIRLGSRVPVFLPQRVDDELCDMLQRYHPIWMNLHFNHPNEITPEVSRAVDRLTRAGIPVGNQSVLLAGVNDCVHVMRGLVHKLVENRIRPYYIYQCDLVEGSGHFRTPVGKGLEIMEGLRGHTSGYAVPTYVIDAPGGGGKIPVMPNYLISYSDHKVVLRNYEGYITTYEEPETYRRHDSAACSYCRQQRPEPGQSGVHGLLAGERMWIEPKGFEEIHARGNVEQHRLQDPSKWVPYGVGVIEGQASRALPVLAPVAGTTDANGTGLGVPGDKGGGVPGDKGGGVPGDKGGGVPGDALLPTERAATDTNAGMVDPEALLPEEQRHEATDSGATTAASYGPGEEPRPLDGEPQASAHGELL